MFQVPPYIIYKIEMDKNYGINFIVTTWLQII
jgi:hypothetical protein